MKVELMDSVDQRQYYSNERLLELLGKYSFCVRKLPNNIMFDRLNGLLDFIIDKEMDFSIGISIKIDSKIDYLFMCLGIFFIKDMTEPFEKLEHFIGMRLAEEDGGNEEMNGADAIIDYGYFEVELSKG